MAIVWRLTAPEYADRLDGKGNVERGARWNSPGRGVVYASFNLSLAVLEAPRELVHNQAFNVGRSDENYRIRDLAEIVKETVPGCRVEYAPDASPDKRSYRVDFEKFARTFPSFTPRWSARQGAADLYAAYQRVGLKLEEFEGPKYKRIDHIKHLLEIGRLDASLRWVERPAAPDSDLKMQQQALK